MNEHVMLIGMMGAGKTTTGRLVAALLGRSFHDSDEEVLARTGMTVPELFALHGEPAFRAQERAVLASALTSGVPSVIAVAGGAVFDPDSRRRMQHSGVIIWLRATPHTLGRRVGSGVGRPLLDDDPAGTLYRLDALRRPLYQALADDHVDVDGVSRSSVAERVARLARERLAARHALVAAYGKL
jgi:shikimate kinase